jgi:hypothetical protein
MESSIELEPNEMESSIELEPNEMESSIKLEPNEMESSIELEPNEMESSSAPLKNPSIELEPNEMESSIELEPNKMEYLTINPSIDIDLNECESERSQSSKRLKGIFRRRKSIGRRKDGKQTRRGSYDYQGVRASHGLNSSAPPQQVLSMK